MAVWLISTQILCMFQVKITSSNEEMLRAAVEQFIDKEPQQIEDVAMSTLEGHQVDTITRVHCGHSSSSNEAANKEGRAASAW